MNRTDRIDLADGQPDRQSLEHDSAPESAARGDEGREGGLPARLRAAASAFAPSGDPLVAIRQRIHARARRRRVLAALPVVLLVVGGAGYGLAANGGLVPGPTGPGRGPTVGASHTTATTAIHRRAKVDGSGALSEPGSSSNSAPGEGSTPGNGAGTGAGNFSLQRALGRRIPTPRPSLVVSSSTTGSGVRVVIRVLFCFGDARSTSGPLPEATVDGRTVDLHGTESAEWIARLSLPATEEDALLRTEVTCANGQADTTTVLP